MVGASLETIWDLRNYEFRTAAVTWGKFQKWKSFHSFGALLAPHLSRITPICTPSRRIKSYFQHTTDFSLVCKFPRHFAYWICLWHKKLARWCPPAAGTNEENARYQEIFQGHTWIWILLIWCYDTYQQFYKLLVRVS